MKKLHQKGFTLVEGLFIIIALSMVVGVGYYVITSNKDTDAAPTKVIKDSAEPTTGQTNKKQYLKIPELGIKLPVSKELEGATYELSPDEKSVAVSTPAFTKAVNDCTSPTRASGTPVKLRVISKYDGTYDKNAAPNNFYDTFAKQLNGFYLEIGRPDGDLCDGEDATKNQVAKNLYDSLAPELNTAVEQAEAL